MTRLTPPKPSPTAPVASNNTTKLYPTREAARRTSHIGICGYGESLDGGLFIRLRFLHQGESITHLLALAGLTVASQEFERLNFYGARLISPQARRELIDRVQATREHANPWGAGPRVAAPIGSWLTGGGERGPVPKLVWRVKLVAELQPYMATEASPHDFACSRCGSADAASA